jgi:hypothetical protein
LLAPASTTAVSLTPTAAQIASSPSVPTLVDIAPSVTSSNSSNNNNNSTTSTTLRALTPVTNPSDLDRKQQVSRERKDEQKTLTETNTPQSNNNNNDTKTEKRRDRRSKRVKDDENNNPKETDNKSSKKRKDDTSNNKTATEAKDNKTSSAVIQPTTTVINVAPSASSSASSSSSSAASSSTTTTTTATATATTAQKNATTTATGQPHPPSTDPDPSLDPNLPPPPISRIVPVPFVRDCMIAVIVGGLLYEIFIVYIFISQNYKITTEQDKSLLFYGFVGSLFFFSFCLCSCTKAFFFRLFSLFLFPPSSFLYSLSLFCRLLVGIPVYILFGVMFVFINMASMTKYVLQIIFGLIIPAILLPIDIFVFRSNYQAFMSVFAVAAFVFLCTLLWSVVLFFRRSSNPSISSFVAGFAALFFSFFVALPVSFMFVLRVLLEMDESSWVVITRRVYFCVLLFVYSILWLNVHFAFFAPAHPATVMYLETIPLTTLQQARAVRWKLALSVICYVTILLVLTAIYTVWEFDGFEFTPRMGLLVTFAIVIPLFVLCCYPFGFVNLESDARFLVTSFFGVFFPLAVLFPVYRYLGGGSPGALAFPWPADPVVSTIQNEDGDLVTVTTSSDTTTVVYTPIPYAYDLLNQPIEFLMAAVCF